MKLRFGNDWLGKIIHENICHQLVTKQSSIFNARKSTSFQILNCVLVNVNTNSIVMWEILPNNADWDCFKTLTLREILKIQNPLLEEHCAFLEVIHLFQ